LREDLVPLTEARTRFFELVKSAHQRPVLLLRHSRPVAVLLSAAQYQALLDEIEDLKDRISVLESENEPQDMRVSWDKLKAEAGLPQAGRGAESLESA
jgi:antitoxin StbD